VYGPDHNSTCAARDRIAAGLSLSEHPSIWSYGRNSPNTRDRRSQRVTCVSRDNPCKVNAVYCVSTCLASAQALLVRGGLSIGNTYCPARRVLNWRGNQGASWTAPPNQLSRSFRRQTTSGLQNSTGWGSETCAVPGQMRTCLRDFGCSGGRRAVVWLNSLNGLPSGPNQRSRTSADQIVLDLLGRVRLSSAI